MEVSAHYPHRSITSTTSFDSTDKILDEIDAKLHGVTKKHLTKEFDVNEDPGVDPSSIQLIRHHMAFSSDRSQANEPKYNGSLTRLRESSEETKPASKTFHEKRTNLLQLYDDDINLLRKMLQENGETAQSLKASEREPVKSEVFNCPVDDSPAPRNCITEETSEKKAVEPLQREAPMPQIVENEPDLCTCGCEAELAKITKERDELRARIRRGEASRTSIEERQELERQLHSTKSSLFQQRKKSRQQLEDIEEKLEEAQHYYDEKLAEKDDVIGSLQEKIDSLQRVNREASTDPVPPPPANDNRADVEIRERDAEIKRLSELLGKRDQALEDLKVQLDKEVKRSAMLANDRSTTDRAHSEGKLNALQSKFDKEMRGRDEQVARLEGEREKFVMEVATLTQKLEGTEKEVERKEKETKEILLREGDYKATSKLLKHKIESLKEELSAAFASKAESELECRRKEDLLLQEGRAKENELKDEKKRLEDELQQMKIEVTQAVSKLKEFKTDIERQDQSLASSLYEECDKLSKLLQSVQSSTNIARKTYGSLSKSSPVCKRAIGELQDVIGTLCRSVTDLICEQARLKREARKKNNFSATYRGNADAATATDEVKTLRERLNGKELELRELQGNMNQWKDLTAQRLAEKFQEELHLQVERKLAHHRSENVRKPKEAKIKPDLGRFSSSTSNLTNTNASQHGDTSTVKLLCHLQGRVKQLRSENDLLRSSNFIKGLDGS